MICFCYQLHEKKIRITKLENLKFYILNRLKMTVDKIIMSCDHGPVLSILIAPSVVVLVSSGDVSEEESK